MSGRLANVLVERGVKPGDRVAVQVEKSSENLMLYLATLRAGAVYLPLNTAYTLAELDYFIGDAEPTLVVCDAVRREGLATVAQSHRVAALDTLDASGKGTLIEAAAGAPRVHRRGALRERPRRHSLHRAPPAAPRARCSPIAASGRRSNQDAVREAGGCRQGGC